MHTHQLTLDGRIRALLQDVLRGDCPAEDATLRLRGEVIAGFFRGVDSEKKRSGGRRSLVEILP